MKSFHEPLGVLREQRLGTGQQRFRREGLLSKRGGIRHRAECAGRTYQHARRKYAETLRPLLNWLCEVEVMQPDAPCCGNIRIKSVVVLEQQRYIYVPQ